MKYFLLAIQFLIIVNCATSQDGPSNRYKNSKVDKPLVEPKYSLAADRQAFDELREQVPAEKKVENDEAAFLLQLFSNPQRPPAQIRDQFDQNLRKKRQSFDQDLRKEREKFTIEERKKKEQFLKDQKKSRDDFNRQKQNREEKNEFYRDQDQKRSEYFADERDRRRDFESDIAERRRNFEDYVRQKRSEFNEELRIFTQKQKDLLKERQNQKINQNSVVPDSSIIDLDAELLKAGSMPGTQLEAGE